MSGSAERRSRWMSEDLKTEDGPANKRTLLMALAGVDGVRVPQIFSGLDDPELIVRLNEGDGLRVTHPDEYYGGIPPGWCNYQVFVRGAFRSPADSLVVDVLPTFKCSSLDEVQEAVRDINNSAHDPKLLEYLKRNFRIQVLPDVEVLYQASGMHIYMEASIITRDGDMGKMMHCSFYGHGKDGGVTSQSYLQADGRWFGCFDIDYFLVGDSLVKGAVLPVVERVVNKCNRVLGGEYDYKIDMLVGSQWNPSEVIQVRVVDRQMTDERRLRNRDEVRAMIAGGVPLVEIELRELWDLNRRIPDGGCVLRLNNKNKTGELLRLSQMLDLEYGGIQAVVVPDGFGRGVQKHQGFNVIAYALYWGLPVVFESNLKDVK